MHAHALDLSVLAKPQHADTLSRAIAVLEGASLPFGGAPYAPGSTERALEVLYAAQRLRGAGAVLDIGTTFASPDYLGLLLHLVATGVQVQGVDIIAPERVLERYPPAWRDHVLALPLLLGDMRTIAVPEAAYDVCTCISTLEHIGFDAPAPDGPSAFVRGQTPDTAPMLRGVDTDARVLSRIARALKPGGVLILTVPAGQGGAVVLRDSLGLYTRQWEYEAESLYALTQHPAFVLEDLRCYRDTPDGWVAVASVTDLADVSSQLRPHAVGCALMVLRKV